MITEICGTWPDDGRLSPKIRPKPPSAAAPSWRRAPADSRNATTGTRSGGPRAGQTRRPPLPRCRQSHRRCASPARSRRSAARRRDRGPRPRRLGPSGGRKSRGCPDRRAARAGLRVSGAALKQESRTRVTASKGALGERRRVRRRRSTTRTFGQTLAPRLDRLPPVTSNRGRGGPTSRPDEFDFIVVSPAGRPDAAPRSRAAEPARSAFSTSSSRRPPRRR